MNLDDSEDEGKDIYGDPGALPTKDNLKGTEGPDAIYGLLSDDILYGGPSCVVPPGCSADKGV